MCNLKKSLFGRFPVTEPPEKGNQTDWSVLEVQISVFFSGFAVVQGDLICRGSESVRFTSPGLGSGRLDFQRKSNQTDWSVLEVQISVFFQDLQ